MRRRTSMVALAAAPVLYCAAGLWWCNPAVGASDSSETIRRHDLVVQIDPERHTLTAVDRLTIELAEGRDLRFSLAPTLHLDRLALSSSDGSAGDTGTDIAFEVEHPSAPSTAQFITLGTPLAGAGERTLTAYYHGTINDPPREPRHLRFVTPSETSGHIGPEGLYLSSETQWYVDVPDSLSEYRLRVALPAAWTAVTQAKVRSSGPCPSALCPEAGFILTEWEPIRPTEALTLVANRFVANTRDWISKGGQHIQLGTYLFPEDAQLADEYLEATARYLDAYITVLGPYPFDSFAVVENFFASGLGMPTFTLLGSGVIKRHYVQPYALGHEIVHSWIGNAVFNRTDHGNWVEGLTTYLANYYWHEWSGDHDQAREQRRLMLRGYNLHVPPERDYPVIRFTQKHDERDNAIGYQKAAMVFHLLRQEIGDGPFWRSLKQLVARYQGRRAEWRDLEQVLADTSGKDLRWFFRQWVEESGAPRVTIKDATARSVDGGRFQLEGNVVQADPAFHILLPLVVRLSSGEAQAVPTRLTADATPFSAVLAASPLSIEVDPDATVFRRIPREQLPPVFNHYVTDARRAVVSTLTAPEDAAHPFQQVVKRIQSQESQQPLSARTAVIPLVDDLLLPPEGSVLLLGSPASRGALQAALESHCGSRVQLREAGVTIDGKAYDGQAVAALITCHRRNHPGSVVTGLYAVSPQAATTVARLLFFYGWHSMVVFQDGKVIARRDWEPAGTATEVSIDEHPPNR